MGEHMAWLGFGFEELTEEQLGLCQPDSVYIDAGICYVNLDVWTLEPFGGGGTPWSKPHTLPPEVLNVTRLAGGHKVHLPSITTDLRARVVLRAGSPGETCRLANWTFEEAGETKRAPLANVLDWEIKNLSDRTLVFTGQDKTIRVSLPATGDVHLVLAHVSKPEVKHLPPARPGTVSKAVVVVAPHFDSFYELLRSPDSSKEPLPPMDPRRKHPGGGRAIRTKACSVRVSDSRKSFDELHWGIGTIACMVASADPQ
jgi:hypothetical protein